MPVAAWPVSFVSPDARLRPQTRLSRVYPHPARLLTAMDDPLSADLASLRIDRDSVRRRRVPGWLVSVIVVGALGALGYFEGLPRAKAWLFKTEVAVTEISQLSSGHATVELTSTGYVVPQVLAKVGAKTPGRIAKANLREGDTVKAGAVLFELDSVDQKSSLAAAQARVAVARARVQVALANADETQAQLERQKRLLQSGATTEAQVEDLSKRLASLQHVVKATEAEVTAAQAETSIAATALKDLIVLAPMNGIAVTRPAQIGDVVAPSQTLVELADFDSLRIETDVPEPRMSVVRIGGPCEVVLDAQPSRRLRGVVREIAPRLNRAKATATVKVQVTDSAELRPEMAARVSFLSAELTEAEMNSKPKVVVPVRAVVDRGEGKIVFAVADGRVRAMPVVLGEATGAGYELRSGPAPGTRVVRDPPGTLVDGQAIKERSSP
jgi:RND family efflux transporter MFP subunit